MKRQTNVSQLNIRKCIDQRARYEGYVELSEMPRLCEALADDRGQVVFELQFGVDEEGHPFLEGHCESDVTLTCERCLGTMPLQLSSDFQVGMVYSDEQAKHLAKRYEPVIVHSEILDATSILEDEMILSLPMYAMHENADCAGTSRELAAEDGSQSDEVKDNPFSVLAQLKK